MQAWYYYVRYNNESQYSTHISEVLRMIIKKTKIRLSGPFLLMNEFTEQILQLNKYETAIRQSDHDLMNSNRV